MNRFDQIGGQDYVSTYVRPPLELYASLAKDYQDKYRQGKAIPGEVDEFASKIENAPIHADLKNAVVGEYKGRINDLVNSAKAEDYAKPEFQEKANRIKRDFTNDPRLNVLKNTKAWWDKEYQPYMNNKENKRNINLTNFQDEKGNLIQTDQGVYSNDFVQYKENSKDLKTIMDDVSIDGTPLSSISKWKRDGNYFIDQDGHRKEVTPEKIRAVALANTENYANTEGGGFRFATIMNKIGADPHMSYTEFKYNDNIPEATKKAVDQELANDLESYGKKQIFKDTDIKYSLKDNDLALYNAKKDIDEAQVLGTTSQSEGINNDQVPTDIKKILDAFDNSTVKSGTKEAGDRTAKMGSWLNFDFNSSKIPNAEKTKIIQDIQDKNPDLKGLTPQQTIDTFKKAYKSLSNESIPLNSISNVAAENIADGIVRNKIQRNFYVMDSKGTTKVGTIKETLDELGITEQEFDKQLAGNPKEGVRSAIGGYTQAGPIAGSYYAEIKDKDGESRRVMISPDNEQQKIFKVSQSVNDARKTMSKTVVTPFPDNPNYQVLVNPSINKDGTVKWEYKEIILGADGNPVGVNNITLDQLRESEKNYLNRSGYLGSNTTVLKKNTTQ